MGVPVKDNPVPVVVYDLSIPDLEERKQKVITFKTLIAAARFFGYNKGERINQIIHSRKRIEKDGKLYAIRYGKKEENKTQG